MTALPESLQQDTVIDLMVAEAVKISEIEGEVLSRSDVMSSIKQAQQSNEITSWIIWFVKMLLEAQTDVENKIEFTLKKTKLLDRTKDILNERQLKVLLRMLKEGPEEFKGGMSAKNYMTIARTTKATATRGMQDLVRKKYLSPPAADVVPTIRLNYKLPL
jgi:Fic family protein